MSKKKIPKGTINYLGVTKKWRISKKLGEFEKKIAERYHGMIRIFIVWDTDRICLLQITIPVMFVTNKNKYSETDKF